MKLLTVAVPSYNMEKLLPQCLDSMADEGFSESLEVLVVDDGSSDGTAAVARRYAEKWPAIFTLVSKENGGHGSAVNAALDRAAGKYFRIVDADDWVNRGNLKRLLEVMKKAEADVILDEKTEVDHVTGAQQYFEFPQSMPSGREVPFESIEAPEFRYHLALHTMSVRTELLKAHGIRLLEKTFYVDSQFVLEATAYAKSALVLRMGIYFYRVGNVNQSVHYLGYVKRYQEHDRVLTACVEFLKKADFAPEKRAYVAHSVALLANTQYKIALIFNPDRRQGREWAKTLRGRLLREIPEVAKATDRRYLEGMILNRLGIGFEGMMKIKTLVGKVLAR
jgi:glycosyltransferase involved in cell wall biosynthesis